MATAITSLECDHIHEAFIRIQDRMTPNHKKAAESDIYTVLAGIDALRKTVKDEAKKRRQRLETRTDPTDVPNEEGIDDDTGSTDDK